MSNVNKVNVQHAINIMERAKASPCGLSMESWQSCRPSEFSPNEETLHKRKTSACLAGHIACSNEFQSSGGKFCVYTGGPVGGTKSIASWLGIGRHDSEVICCTSGDQAALYNKYRNNVTYDDVLEVLRRLLDTGSIWPNSVNTA